MTSTPDPIDPVDPVPLDSGEPLKRCPSCSSASPSNPDGISVYLPLTAFYRVKSNPDGYSHQCRTCRKAIQRAYYRRRMEALHPDRLLAQTVIDLETAADTITVTNPDGSTTSMTLPEYEKSLGLDLLASEKGPL